MSGARSKFKVLKPVVVLDFVEVVDVFVGAESAPKMALHDEAMLKDVDSVARELNVSVASYFSGDGSIPALTRTEAHIAACCSGWLDSESVSARLAFESDSHSNPASAW